MTDFATHRRALLSVVGGSASDARSIGVFVKGVYPSHVKHGRGAFVFDNKSKYLDFMACGGLSVFGAAETQLTQALSTELIGGIIHSLPTHHEYECAEALKDSFPFVDQWKFFKSKGDAMLYAEDIGRDLKIADDCAATWWVPKGSPSGSAAVYPDVLVIGGALASGLSLYAVGGKYDTMATPSICTTDNHSGEILALTAAKVTARLLQSRYDPQRLLTHGKAFTDEFNAVCPELVRIEGPHASMGEFHGNQTAIALFCQAACKAGMLFGPIWRMSFPMIEEYKNALNPIKAILLKIKRGELRLEGEMPV